MKHRYLTGLVALMAGVALNHLGDRLLGVKVELFSGLSTFSFAWGVDLFVLPFFCRLGRVLDIRDGGEMVMLFPALDRSQHELC